MDIDNAPLPHVLRPVRHLLVYGAVVSLVLGSSVFTLTPGVGEGTGTPIRPNIVLIVTDDQRWDISLTRFMPRMSERFVPGVNAVTFDQAFITDPVCCPSRVSILTGNYPSTTGVFANEGRFTGPRGTGGGGFKAFNDDPRVNPTIAVDLHDAGYRTMLVGKYLNHYDPTKMSRYVPPGWDRWFATDGGAYYNYAVATGHGVRRFGNGAQDYSSRVFAETADRFVSSSVAGGTPFSSTSHQRLRTSPPPQRYTIRTGSEGRSRAIEIRSLSGSRTTLPSHRWVATCAGLPGHTRRSTRSTRDSSMPSTASIARWLNYGRRSPPTPSSSSRATTACCGASTDLSAKASRTTK